MPTLKKVYTESYRSGFYHPISILILALITLTVALAIFANSGFFANKNVPAPPSPTPLLSPKPTPKASPTDPTANWKTYTNTKNRYSIQYPSNLQLIVDNNRPSITNNNNGTEHYFNISIDVSDNLKNQTTQDFVNMSKILTASGEYKNPFVSPKLYTNGVIKGMISDVTNGDDYYVEVIQVNNGQIYEFKLLSGPDTGTKPTDEDKTTFNKILSTFKFLN